MNKGRTYFAVSSVVFLIVLAISPFKDFFREWKWYQYEYNSLVGEMPQRIKPADIGSNRFGRGNWTESIAA